MSHAKLTLPTPGAPHHFPFNWRRLIIILGIVALVGGGLWWANQSQWLDTLLGQQTQTVATTVTGPSITQGVTQPTGQTAAAAPASVAAEATTLTYEKVLTKQVSQPSVSLPAISGIRGTQLWDADGNLVATFESGVSLTATGRSLDSAWLAVQTDVGAGWVQAAQVVLYDVEQLPEVAPPSAVAASGQVVDATFVEPATTTDTGEGAMSRTTETEIVATTGATATTITAAGVTATVATTGAHLNVRSGPSTAYAVIVQANQGDTLTVVGRNEAGDWLQVQVANVTDGVGWVAATYLQVTGAVSDLPVVAVAAPPATTAVSSTESPVAAVVTAATGQNAASSGTGLQGTLVFQQSQGGAIYAYNLATGALWQVTTGFDPAISPDGSQVAFTRSGGENGLYLINIDGSNERKLYSGNQPLRSPKWSADGAWIVFSQVTDTYQCYQMGPQCLTEAELLDQMPGLANDADAFADFVADLTVVTNSVWGLAQVNTNGDDYRDLAALNSAVAPDWSNGGIVYQSTAGLQKTADTPDAQNSAVLAEAYVQDPDWQPNGVRIVYQSRQGSHWEIFTVNADGSGKTALTQPVTTLVDQLPSNVAPAWSPDGQYIVFLSNREDNHEAGAWRLWVMNADGSNQQPLPIDLTFDYTYTDEQMVSWGA